MSLSGQLESQNIGGAGGWGGGGFGGGGFGAFGLVGLKQYLLLLHYLS